MTAARVSPLSRLPARVGQLLVAPGAALRRIDAQGGGGGGGFSDAIALVVVGTLAFRLPELVQVALAAAGATSGALMRLVAPFAAEVRDAAWIVLPAALLITALAGARRDPSRDLELGAACYPAFFAVRGLSRALDAVAGMRVLPASVTWTVAGIAAGAVAIRAVAVARARPPAGGGETGSPPVPAGPARSAWLAGIAVATVALVGLGGSAVWSARHFDALRPIHRGQDAPDFSLFRIDDTPGALTMSSLRGQVVVLDFWATWCPPCVAMVPVLRDVHASWAPRGVAFVGINSDGPTPVEEIRAFMATHPLPYPVVADDGRVGGLYRVEALPSLVLVGRDGRIRASFVGYTTQGTLDKAIGEALNAPPTPRPEGG